MRKGKFGVAYAAYVAIALVLAMLAVFGGGFFYVALIGLTLFVLAAEKDEYANNMCLQATGAVTIFSAINVVFDSVIYGLFQQISNIQNINIRGLNDKYEKAADHANPDYDELKSIGKKITKAEKSHNKFTKFMSNYSDWMEIILFIIAIVIAVFLVLALLSTIKQVQYNIPVISKFAAWATGAVMAAKAPKAAPQMAPQGAAQKFCTGCGAPITGPFCTKCGKQA